MGWRGNPAPFPLLFPGEGRGPVGGRLLARFALRYISLSNWVPAVAGEQKTGELWANWSSLPLIPGAKALPPLRPRAISARSSGDDDGGNELGDHGSLIQGDGHGKRARNAASGELPPVKKVRMGADGISRRIELSHYSEGRPSPFRSLFQFNGLSRGNQTPTGGTSPSGSVGITPRRRSPASGLRAVNQVEVKRAAL